MLLLIYIEMVRWLFCLPVWFKYAFIQYSYVIIIFVSGGTPLLFCKLIIAKSGYLQWQIICFPSICIFLQIRVFSTNKKSPIWQYLSDKVACLKWYVRFSWSCWRYLGALSVLMCRLFCPKILGFLHLVYF